MKSIYKVRYLVCLSLFITLVLTVPDLFSQADLAQADPSNEGQVIAIPKASLKYTLSDTILPTLCNSGMGLIRVEKIILPEVKKDFDRNMKGAGNISATGEEVFTEEDLKSLQEQRERMEKQYLLEWQEKIKTERYYFDLEGIIRGVATPPIF